MPLLHNFCGPESEHQFTSRPRRLRRLLCCLAGLLGLPLLAATPWGTAIVAAGEPLAPAAIQAKYAGRDPILQEREEMAVFSGKAEEPKQDCAGLTEGRVMTALVFGQSNAANTVDPGYASGQPVYAYYDGTCQKAHDAIPGASGSKGSVWPRLGDRAVASGLFDAVLFAGGRAAHSTRCSWPPSTD